MPTYYRIQEIGFTWEQTLSHKSSNWGEENADGTAPECGNGICACSDEDDLKSLIDLWFGACPEYLETHEVIEFTGVPLRDVGDGWLVEPTVEISRTSATEWLG